METRKPSLMSTIIKSTPLAMPCTLLKARALSDESCTLQTTFIMKLVPKVEHFHHQALNSQQQGNTFLRKAFISTHSLGKALCCIKYVLVDRRDPKKRNPIFLASCFLWRRILFLSFSRSRLMFTSTSSSYSSPWLGPKAAPFEST